MKLKTSIGYIEVLEIVREGEVIHSTWFKNKAWHENAQIYSSRKKRGEETKEGLLRNAREDAANFFSCCLASSLIDPSETFIDKESGLYRDGHL